MGIGEQFHVAEMINNRMFHQLCEERLRGYVGSCMLDSVSLMKVLDWAETSRIVHKLLASVVSLINRVSPIPT